MLYRTVIRVFCAFTFLMLSIINVYAVRSTQAPTNFSNEVYVDYGPPYAFPGGCEALSNFIKDNLVWPENAKDIEGRVIIQIRVCLTGEIDSIKVVKSVHPALDSEAVRIASILPKFIVYPGAYRELKKWCWFTLPITFNKEKYNSWKYQKYNPL